jgi:hypothetical protein
MGSTQAAPLLLLSVAPHFRAMAEPPTSAISHWRARPPGTMRARTRFVEGLTLLRESPIDGGATNAELAGDLRWSKALSLELGNLPSTSA